jgi:hypothetical protein
MRRVVLMATLLASVALLAACGGGGGSKSPPAGGTSAGASATGTAAPLDARALLPILDGGFQKNLPEDSTVANVQVAYTTYDHFNPSITARVEIHVYPDEKAAKDDFKKQADAWKNPPADLFGTDPKNIDHDALPNFDDARSYLATQLDKNGQRIWTDIYRIGRVQVTAHVLTVKEADADPVRTMIADKIRQELR